MNHTALKDIEDQVLSELKLLKEKDTMNIPLEAVNILEKRVNILRVMKETVLLDPSNIDPRRRRQ